MMIMIVMIMIVMIVVELIIIVDDIHGDMKLTR
jgi:hypothetical protein